MSKTITARGTERSADETSSDEGRRRNRGFIGSIRHAFSEVISSSPFMDTSSAKEAATPLEQAKTPQHVAPGQSSAANQSTTVAETTEQTDAMIRQAMAEAGPIPTDPQDIPDYQARVLDGTTKIRQDKVDAAKFASLNFDRNINPQDEAWITKRAYFVDSLKVKDLIPIEIFDRNFNKTQQLYLTPPSGEGGMILKIQQEHTKDYKEAIGPTGRFRGVQDNLATKLTMLHFGLPIEPMTYNNVTMSGEEGDKTCPPDDPDEPPMVQRIVYAEKPLEFLDKYGNRSHGFPAIRIPKRRYVAPTRPAPATKAPDPKAPAAASTSGQFPVGNGGGEAPRTVVPGASKTPAGDGPETLTGPAPITDSTQADDETGNAIPLSVSEAGNQYAHRHERLINSGRFTVSMRGGALPAQVIVDDRDDAAGGTRKIYRSLDPSKLSFIYGYNGKLRTEATIQSFRKNSLKLLEYDFESNSDYDYMIDVYPKGLGHPPKAPQPIAKDEDNVEDTLRIVFDNLIKPYLDRSTHPDSKIFVRTSTSDPPGKQIEPCLVGMKDIVRLTDKSKGTTYWKIPKGLKDLPRDRRPAYGINQFQPGFLRAMRILFGDQMPGKVQLTRNTEDAELGFAGLEAPIKVWQLVHGAANTLQEGSNETIDFEVSLRPVCTPSGGYAFSADEVGSHLAGSEHWGKGSLSNPTLTYTEIKLLSKAWLPGKKLPDQVKIWRRGQDRERNHASGVFQSVPKTAAIDAIGKIFKNWEDLHLGRTTCLWWRPDFNEFTIQVVMQTDVTTWNPRDPTLQSFRHALHNVFKDPKDIYSFSLMEAESSVDERKFIVTKDTTEDEWRLHIYDWLHADKIFVKAIPEVTYALDHSFAFGSSPPIAGTANATTTPQSTAPYTIGGATENTVQIENTTEGASTAAGGGRSGSRGGPLTPQTPIKYNKERIIATAAGKPKSQRWADWMIEQNYQDGLQRNSWIKDQTVVEPRRLPAPPLFGPTRELLLRTGSSMPTVYAQRLTPTDIRNLQDENQKLRNQVLDRMWACPICDVEFETHDRAKDLIRAHIKEHQKQLEEAGHCHSCGDPQWAFMTNLEKKYHFATHQLKQESAKIKHFYQDQHCPVCDRDLSKMKPEEVIHHCLEHAPSQVQYCDRCGLDLKDCNQEELRHHQHRCRLAKDRQDEDPEPVICKNCGQDITKFTAAMSMKHLKDCQEKAIGRFCEKCGLNENAHHWNRSTIAKHDSHCMPPSGFKKKYCEKCRTEVGTLDDIGVSHHQQTCRRVEPAVPSEHARIIELKQRQDLPQQMDARLNTRKTFIEARDTEQNAREIMLNKREKDVDEKVSTYNNLRLQVEKVVDAQAQKTLEPSRALIEGQNQEGDHRAAAYNYKDGTDCPFLGCGETVAKMSTKDLVDHFTWHANNAGFLCPLENADGTKCNNYFDLRNDGFDLTVHYKHKLSDAEQTAIQKMLTDSGGQYGNLRAAMARNRPQVTSNKAFIADRNARLDAQPTARTSGSVPKSSTVAAPTAGSDLASAPAEKDTFPYTESVIMGTARMTGPWFQQQRPKPGEILTTLMKQSTIGGSTKPQLPVPTKPSGLRSQARRTEAQETALLALASEIAAENDTTGLDVLDPSAAMVGAMIDDRAAGIDKAVTRRGAAAMERAKLLVARARRASASHQAYVDLGVGDSSTSIESESDVPPLPKKKGRSPKTPVKAAPAVSKKRKQAEVEEEPAATRTMRNAPPQKQQSKAEETTIAVETPKKAGKSTAKPAKKTGRSRKAQEPAVTKLPLKRKRTPAKK